MNETMVLSAQKNQIIHARLTAIRPVLDMVSVNIVFASAAGKAAAMIAALQGPADRKSVV